MAATGAIRAGGRGDYLVDQAMTVFAAASLLLGAGTFFGSDDGWSVTFNGMIPEPGFPSWFYTGCSLALLFLSACLGVAAIATPVRRFLGRFRILFRVALPALAWCGLLAGWLATLSELQRDSLPYAAFLWIGFGWLLLLGVRLVLSVARTE
jgi:hypothetical protein